MPLEVQQLFENAQITINVEEIKKKFTDDQKERQRQCVEQYYIRKAAYHAITQPQEYERENSYGHSSSGENHFYQNGNGLKSHSTDDYPQPEAETDYASKRQKLGTDATTTELNATVNDLLNVPVPVLATLTVAASLTVADDVKEEEVGCAAMEVTDDVEVEI